MSESNFLDCNGRRLDLSVPRVMGILNVTPDSFSDGGEYISLDAALRQAERLIEEGAAIIDVGGESTRPGAAEVEADAEVARVAPVVEALAREFDVPISVDTSKPEVMRAAVAAGAGLLNDVRALAAPGALEAAAELGVPVCLMHMRGTPRTMQQAPHYENVVTEVRDELMARVAACEAAGIVRSNILLDPGFGFAKNLGHNCRLLRELGTIVELGFPVLVGVSRKTMIGQILDKPVAQRVQGSVAAAALAVWEGAHIVRVHDVAPTVDAVTVAHAVRTLG